MPQLPLRKSKGIILTYALLSLFVTAMSGLLATFSPLLSESGLANAPVERRFAGAIGIMLIVNTLVFLRLKRLLVDPYESLSRQTKLEAAAFAFKQRSSSAEEDQLKHFIEKITLRTVDLRDEINRLESELAQANESVGLPPSQISALRQAAEAARLANGEKEHELTAVKERNIRLGKELERVRERLVQSQLELKRRQLEKPGIGFSGDYKQAGGPALEHLHDPLSLINNLSWRLAKTWTETPPAKVMEGLEEISRLSEELLDLVKRKGVPTG